LAHAIQANRRRLRCRYARWLLRKAWCRRSTGWAVSRGWRRKGGRGRRVVLRRLRAPCGA
jgi:hypothetical protein